MGDLNRMSTSKKTMMKKKETKRSGNIEEESKKLNS